MRVVALLSSIALAVHAIHEDASKEDLWKEFIQMFARSYGTEEEEAARRAVFYANLDSIDSLRARDSDVRYSHLTPFADWTPDEFRALHGMRAPSTLAAARPAPLLDTAGLPDEFDWRSKGAVNAIQDQGKCGSCWAFSAVANIEGQNFVNGSKTLLKLSEQQLIDCSKVTGNEGCQDGYPKDAFRDMIQTKYGLEAESDYPYKAKESSSCGADGSKEQVFIDSWISISTDEDQIAAALMKYGPLSIAINAGVAGMEFYKGGISRPKEWECPANRINHGVNLVGFGVENGTKYWTVRNTYGAKWGEEGYYRIIRGECGKPNPHYQCCGLNTMVTTALVRPPTTSETIVV